MKKIGELPAITDVPAGSLLIVNTENGTKKITYEDLCQAVKATLGIPTVVQSIDITEPGNIPDGPVIKAAFDSVNDLLLGAATYSAGKRSKCPGRNSGQRSRQRIFPDCISGIIKTSFCQPERKQGLICPDSIRT